MMRSKQGPEADQMPAEHCFVQARPNPFAARLADQAGLAYVGPDGTAHRIAVTARPEADPGNLSGIVDDALFCVYNPRDDVLLARLTASLAEPVTSRCDAPGYEFLVSDDSGLVVGLVVYGFLQRYDYLATLVRRRDGAAVDRDLIQRGLAPLRALLPAA